MSVRVAYIECPAGASGDMFLGAWLDLGIDARCWHAMVEGLRIEGVRIDIRSVFKQGIRALKVDVLVNQQRLTYDGDSGAPDHHHHHDHHHHDGHHHDHHKGHPHRGLREIEEILQASDLPEPVRVKSIQAFRALAEAEGEVHGLPPEQVHFHEVGAVDAIVDVVGAMAGWYLAGMPTCTVSPIEVGGGTVHCAHGLMPVPAPATAILLRGFETYSSGVRGETVTPTGAAILRALCVDGTRSRPHMVVQDIGYGAGDREFVVANVLRIQLGDAVKEEAEPKLNRTSQSELAYVMETNIDDMSPEWAGYVTARLMELGALDTWITPATMKKGRPGYVLHVLGSAENKEALIRALHRETTTLGVRFYPASRSVLERKWVTVSTRYGDVRVKLAVQGGEVVNVAPEYEDCREVASALDIPLKTVYQAAMAVYQQGATRTT